MRIFRNLSIVGSIFLLCNCAHNSESHKEEKHKFLTTTALQKDTFTLNQYVGHIQSINSIEIQSQERGYIEEIFIDEGAMVKKGQLLFKIMPKLYQAEYDKALAESNYAKIEYENTRVLSLSDVVSLNELALAKAGYEKALAELNVAKTHLDFTEIRAPYDGIVDKFRVRKGSLVEEGETLTELADNSKMWVYFNVPEAQYLNIKQNNLWTSSTPVQLQMANNQMFEYEGKITTIEANFNPTTGNIAFRATFPNPKGLLRNGETGNIVIKSSSENVLLIPQKATFEVLSNKYVYTVDEKGKLTPQQIFIDRELPHLFVVANGLSTEDHILLEGLRKVHKGDVIEAEHIDAKLAISELDLYAE